MPTCLTLTRVKRCLLFWVKVTLTLALTNPNPLARAGRLAGGARH